MRILFKVTELLSIQGGPFITVKSKIIMINDHLSGFIDLKINNIMAGTSFIIILWFMVMANHYTGTLVLKISKKKIVKILKIHLTIVRVFKVNLHKKFISFFKNFTNSQISKKISKFCLWNLWKSLSSSFYGHYTGTVILKTRGKEIVYWSTKADLSFL